MQKEGLVGMKMAEKKKEKDEGEKKVLYVKAEKFEKTAA